MMYRLCNTYSIIHKLLAVESLYLAAYIVVMHVEYGKPHVFVFLQLFRNVDCAVSRANRVHRAATAPNLHACSCLTEAQLMINLPPS